jgi:tripartite-type tricarboxylate transporter receptor subunit TctC
MKCRLLLCLVVAAQLNAGITEVAAQEWPNRPVRIVSPFAAGGTADTLARIVADGLSETFKQQFFVEARPGAAGAIGLQSVAASSPDGYNLLLGTVSILTLLPIINPKIGYDALRDLTNIAYVAGAPVVLSVNPANGPRTLQEFVQRAQNASAPLTYSSTGVGSDGHLLGQAFASIAKIKVEHVPYRGAQPALTDLVGGHVAFGMLTVPSTSAFLRGNTLLGLAVTSPERMTGYPTISTFKESDFPEMVSSTWFSLSAPAGLSLDIVDKINRAVVATMAKPQVQERLQQDGLLTRPMGPDQFRAFLQQEAARWKPLIESAGIVQQ